MANKRSRKSRKNSKQNSKRLQKWEAALRTLPFVVDLKKGGRNYWLVQTNDDYGSDWKLGEQFAAVALPIVKQYPYLLSWIVDDMIDKRKRSKSGLYYRNKGVVLGFIKAIADDLCAQSTNATLFTRLASAPKGTTDSKKKWANIFPSGISKAA